MMNDCLGSGEDLDLSVWMDQEIADLEEGSGFRRELYLEQRESEIPGRCPREKVI